MRADRFTTACQRNARRGVFPRVGRQGGVGRDRKTNHGGRLGLSDGELQFLNVGVGDEARRIAFLRRAAQTPDRAGLVWLSGFKSDMASTKASALDDYCMKSGRALLRFD
jgi:hypothetical protein